MKLQFLALLALGLLSTTLAHATPRKSPAHHWVKTYARKNGTVVQGHWAGSGFSATTPSRFNQGGRSPYVPGSMGNFIKDDTAGFSRPANTSDHMYDTYAQDPTLEPSWIREQRREKAEQAAIEQARQMANAPKNKPTFKRRK